MKYILGLDIGGTKTAVILGKNLSQDSEAIQISDNDGINIKIHDRLAFPTEVQSGFQHSLQKIFDNIELIMAKNNILPLDIESIGVSCGGPLDSKRGIIMSPPNLLGWDNIKIVEIMEERFKIKTKLQNDANACALAEWKFGAAKGYNNVVFLTFGTGFGAGLILDGKLYSGTNDMAGEVGHIRLTETGPVGYGKAGSLEGYCSGGGIAQLAKIKTLEKLQVGEAPSFCNSIDKLDTLNAKIIGDAAEAGDELAKEIYRISGYFLGKGLSLIIDILNPEIIVIGSIYARSKDLLWPAAKQVIEHIRFSLW
jgi:glucokinase